jgi:tripartite-type tricarboxylate transporter receptor subunit TctC
MNPALYINLGFNFVRDIAMVAGIQRSPLALEVHPSVPVASVPELIEYVKANPGKISLASFGSGPISQVKVWGTQLDAAGRYQAIDLQ